jgi:hypothetical protein
LVRVVLVRQAVWPRVLAVLIAFFLQLHQLAAAAVLTAIAVALLEFLAVQAAVLLVQARVARELRIKATLAVALLVKQLARAAAALVRLVQMELATKAATAATV